MFQLFRVNDGDAAHRAHTVVILDSHIGRDVMDAFSFDGNEDSRVIHPSEANWVNRVGIGKGNDGAGDAVLPPVFEGEIFNCESGHGLVLEWESVIHLIMVLKVNRSLLSKERLIVYSALPVNGRG
jgi:hypothetical protein